MTASFSRVNSNNYAPISAQAILDELNNPNSQLSKDLYNAKMAALDKKKREKEVLLNVISEKEFRAQVEELEEELAAEREEFLNQSRNNLEKYYAEQHQMNIRDYSLNLQPLFDAASASLDTFEENVRLLLKARQELATLTVERDEALRQCEYYKSDRAFVDTFVQQFNNGGTYRLDSGKTVSFVPEANMSPEKQAECKALKAKLQNDADVTDTAYLEKIRSHRPIFPANTPALQPQFQLSFRNAMAEMLLKELTRKSVDTSITIQETHRVFVIKTDESFVILKQREATATIRLNNVETKMKETTSFIEASEACLIKQSELLDSITGQNRKTADRFRNIQESPRAESLLNTSVRMMSVGG